VEQEWNLEIITAGNVENPWIGGKSMRRHSMKNKESFAIPVPEEERCSIRTFPCIRTG